MSDDRDDAVSGAADGRTDGSDPDPVALSAAFLAAVRDGEPAGAYRDRLAALPPDALAAGLPDRPARLAFWTNVYNAFAQALLADDPDRYEPRWFGLVRPIFADPLVTVAGHDLSLNDVEHGILRGSMSGIGLGYLPRVRVGDFERRFRLERADPRVHFALNCGARSCPPVRVYGRDRVDEQLDAATRAYLDGEVRYDADASAATVPRLMLWYRGDFGGTEGIYEFLWRYDAVPEGRRPGLSYADYDWTMKLGRFAGPEAE